MWCRAANSLHTLFAIDASPGTTVGFSWRVITEATMSETSHSARRFGEWQTPMGKLYYWLVVCGGGFTSSDHYSGAAETGTPMNESKAKGLAMYRRLNLCNQQGFDSVLCMRVHITAIYNASSHIPPNFSLPSGIYLYGHVLCLLCRKYPPPAHSTRYIRRC